MVALLEALVADAAEALSAALSTAAMEEDTPAPTMVRMRAETPAVKTDFTFTVPLVVTLIGLIVPMGPAVRATCNSRNVTVTIGNLGC
ncbi:hypothetical protein [Oleisolibacter albus]|uniref:hypothetical protein n=1 Tax=Oleisolibacter albus TaxID=2171757 RepID=UPI000DF452CB|nr:hypothetical protein [Oleisolibacter albus]